jgi:hypothetical protein
VWLVVDLVIAIAAAIFLTLIPGPNVVLLYFILRIFSHYRALQGIRAGVASDGAEFKPTAALDDLENALQSRSPDRVAVCAAADALNIPGLTPFIERML